ncbi:MAG: hypothetical protein Q8P67_09465, partial [archaeon]|nr:hypothetical protein [archaeon]
MTTPSTSFVASPPAPTPTTTKPTSAAALGMPPPGLGPMEAVPWNAQLVDIMYQVQARSKQLWQVRDDLQKLVAEGKEVTTLLRDTLRLDLDPTQRTAASSVAAAAPELLRAVQTKTKGESGSLEGLRTAVALLDQRLQLFFSQAVLPASSPNPPPPTRLDSHTSPEPAMHSGSSAEISPTSSSGSPRAKSRSGKSSSSRKRSGSRSSDPPVDSARHRSPRDEESGDDQHRSKSRERPGSRSRSSSGSSSSRRSSRSLADGTLEAVAEVLAKDEEVKQKADEIAALQEAIQKLRDQNNEYLAELRGAQSAASDSKSDIDHLMSKVEELQGELKGFHAAATSYTSKQDRSKQEYQLIEKEIYHSPFDFDGAGRLLCANNIITQLDLWECWSNSSRPDSRLLSQIRNCIKAVALKFYHHSRVLGHLLSMTCSLLDALQTSDQHIPRLSGSSIRNEGILSCCTHEYKRQGLLSNDDYSSSSSSHDAA